MTATTHRCAIKGRAVTDDECTSINLAATAVEFDKCLTCPAGVARAKTATRDYADAAASTRAQLDAGPAARVAPGQPELEAQDEEGQETPPTATEPLAPASSARELVHRALGTNSDFHISKKLGCSQPPVSAIFRALAKGVEPKGPTYQTLLQRTGLTTERLLRPHAVANFTEHALELMPGQPAVGMENAPPLGNPDGPAVVGYSDAEPQEPQTPAEILADLIAAKPPADSPASSLPQPSGPALATAGPGGIPEDFEPYQGMPHGSPYVGPMVVLRKHGEIVLTSEAVRAFGVVDMPRARLFWSARRGQIGILPMRDSGPGALRLQNGKGDDRRISSAFLRAHNITARGAFPVTLGPGGMLVATIITDQAAQGGKEAA